jgi:hypothetical protein
VTKAQPKNHQNIPRSISPNYPFFLLNPREDEIQIKNHLKSTPILSHFHQKIKTHKNYKIRPKAQNFLHKLSHKVPRRKNQQQKH